MPFPVQRPRGSFSYIIYKEGNMVRAEDAKGNVEFEGADAATVIKAAADAIPNGGRIVLKPGIYLINSMIEISSKAVLLEGESLSYKEDYGVSAILRANASIDYIIKITGQWTSLEKLVIDGNYKAGGVHLGALDNYIFRCFIFHCSQYGVYLAGINQWVEDCWIEWNPIGMKTLDNSKVLGNHFVENDQSVSISGGRNVWVVNNLFRNPTTRSINLWGTPSRHVIIAFNVFEIDTGTINEFILLSSGKEMDRVKIMGNIIDGGGVTDYFMNADDNVTLTNVEMMFNDIKDINTAPIHYGSGVTGTIKAWRNRGYITENSGTATIINGSNSVQFAHGLAGTPTLVVLGATHSEVADAVWSADATNITISVPNNVTADRDISWYAEYKP